MNDYLLFLEEIGVTSEQMEDAVKTGVPYLTEEMDGIQLRKSEIHGVGTFSTRPFNLGESLGAGMKSKQWTILGRFGNHSSIPNMRAEQTEEGFCFVADRAIRENEELTVNYRSVKSVLTKEGR